MMHLHNHLVLPPVRDYVPYQPGPFRTAMGLTALDLADWIELDERLPVELAEKKRLLTERHKEVFAALPAADQGSAETLAILVDHLCQHFPQVYQKEGAQLHNQATDETWNLAAPACHPLELASRLVQEDLCLMGQDQATEDYLLTGGSVCFPTRWRLHEKLGKPLDAIHAPTPRYANQLAAPVNRLFARLTVDKPVWRTNWGVVDDPILFQPTGHGMVDYSTAVTSENAGELLWLRMERQTLRRLPASGDILFTIRIYVQSFAQLAQQPGRALRLAQALRGLDPEMRVYKSLPPILEAAVAWLERSTNHELRNIGIIYNQ